MPFESSPAQCGPAKPTPYPELQAPRLDWLADLVIPALVFGLLGTLLYFLIDLRQYLAGGEAAILRYVVFWFLLGVIGLARMSARPGSTAVRPEFYCLLLGGAVVLVVFQLSIWEGTLAAPGEKARPGLALMLNLMTVAGIWLAAWFLTAICTRPEHALEELRHGGLTSRAGYSRVAAAPLRAVMVVSGLAVAVFGYGLALVRPDHPVHRHAYVCAALYVLFALLLMALINLGAVRLAAQVGGLRIRRAITPGWVAGAAVLAVFVLLTAALLPGLASRREVRQPGEGRRQAREEDRNGQGRGLQPYDSRWRDWGPDGSHPWMGGSEPIPGGHERQDGSQRQTGRLGRMGQMIQRVAEALARELRWLAWLLLAIVILTGLALLFWQRQRVARCVMALLLAIDRLLAWLHNRFVRPRPAPGEVELPRDPWADIFAGTDPSTLDPSMAVRHVWRAVQLFYEGLGLPRRECETEMEFARRVPSHLRVRTEQVKRLALLYATCEYGEALPQANTVEELRELWAELVASVQAAREARSAVARRL